MSRHYLKKIINLLLCLIVLGGIATSISATEVPPAENYPVEAGLSEFIDKIIASETYQAFQNWLTENENKLTVVIGFLVAKTLEILDALLTVFEQLLSMAATAIENN